VVVHAGAEVGDDVEGPALAGVVQFQYLSLTFEVSALVVAGDACIDKRLAQRLTAVRVAGVRRPVASQRRKVLVEAPSAVAATLIETNLLILRVT
jgi:hypothetical protein